MKVHAISHEDEHGVSVACGTIGARWVAETFSGVTCLRCRGAANHEFGLLDAFELWASNPPVDTGRLLL